MPKDATKNVDRYKIRGGQLNEFELHQNQEQYVKDKTVTGKQLIPAKAAKASKTIKASKKTTKATKAKNTAPARGATAKKLAARKAAKKK